MVVVVFIVYDEAVVLVVLLLFNKCRFEVAEIFLTYIFCCFGCSSCTFYMK